VGGDVLQVEVSKLQGKGALQITGSLGDVMKESTRIAFSVVKGLIDNKKLIIDKKLIPHTAKEEEEKTKVSISEVYKRFDLHIHFPDGATPKDGPSAGIAISTVISSILSDRKIRSDVAMTGEVSLKGKVMPIGGLKEKMIAAHRAGMKTVIIPIKNYERDLNDIPDEVKNDLKIIAVKQIEEVLKIALVD
jgi:ATP-dependent Lon protease